jgi:uncharacterized protein (TIGR02996 family)
MNEAIRVFLRAIAAAPNDDLPRLVFADWLTENGRQERAELIRIEVEIARTFPGSPNRAKLFERRQDLLKLHAAEWFKKFDGKVTALQTERGFITSLRCDASTFLEHASSWFETQPITHLKIDSVWSNSGNRKICHAREFFTSQYLGQITQLDLEYAMVNPAGLYWLSQNPTISALKEINLRNNNVGDDGVRTIARMHGMIRLESLDLVNNRISDRGAALLIGAMNLPMLRELRLSMNPISREVWGELEKRFRRTLIG